MIYDKARNDAATGVSRVNFDRMKDAVSALSEKIPRLQGDEDCEGPTPFSNRGPLTQRRTCL